MATTYNLLGIPDGRNGVRQTLKMMSEITGRYKTAPAIFELSRQIIKHLPQKAWKKEARAILQWAQKNIRYVKDVKGVETLQTPIQTLRLGQGDCDDFSMLIAALMESIGHPTRFMAVGMREGHFSHVFVQTKIGGKWVTMEGTENWPLGRNPPNIKCAMVHTNK